MQKGLGYPRAFCFLSSDHIRRHVLQPNSQGYFLSFRQIGQTCLGFIILSNGLFVLID
jgi:hypothetical protein